MTSKKATTKPLSPNQATFAEAEMAELLRRLSETLFSVGVMTPPIIGALVNAIDPEWLDQMFTLGAENPNPTTRTLYEWRCYLLGNVLRDAARSLTRNLDVNVTLRPDTRA